MLLPFVANLLDERPPERPPQSHSVLAAPGAPVVVASDDGRPVVAYFPRAGVYHLVESRGVLRLLPTLEARPEDAYVPRPGTYRVTVVREAGRPPAISVRPS